MVSTWALTNLQKQSQIIIPSVSQAAIMAINSTNTHSRVVLDITDSTHQVPNKLELRWVPKHTGVPGDECADKLTRAGLTSGPTGPEPFLPILNRAIQMELFNCWHSLHLSQYGRLPISSMGRISLTIFLKKHRHTLGKLKREHRRWITWQLPGHRPLAYFQHAAP